MSFVLPITMNNEYIALLPKHKGQPLHPILFVQNRDRIPDRLSMVESPKIAQLN